jgi:hypothetical protein
MGKCKRKTKQLRTAEDMHEGLKTSIEGKKPAKDTAKNAQKKNDVPSSRSLAFESSSEGDAEEVCAGDSHIDKDCGLCNRQFMAS